MSGNNKKQRHTPSPPQRIEVRMQDIAAILERTRTVLSTEQQATLTTAIDTLAWVTAELQTKHTSLERLRRMLFGASTERGGAGCSDRFFGSISGKICHWV
jgi:hypothetical protein